jgi:hypothetical protein
MHAVLLVALIGSSITSGLAGGGNNNNRFPFPGNFGGSLNFGDEIVARVVSDKIYKIFQGNLKAQAYKAKLPSKPVKNCRDLDCDFDPKGKDKGSCRWHNVQNDGGVGATNVFLGTGKAKNQTWDIIMGSSAKPEKGFGLVASQKTNTSIWFVSDPIPRLDASEAYISLKHWISPYLKVKACTRFYDPHTDPSRRDKPYTWINCSKKLVYDTQHGPDKLILKGPIKEKFEIVLVFGPWPLKQGGLILVDDIKYRYKGC